MDTFILNLPFLSLDQEECIIDDEQKSDSSEQDDFDFDHEFS